MCIIQVAPYVSYGLNCVNYIVRIASCVSYRLYCVDYIMYIVWIILCGLHYADCIMQIALCRLYRIDCIVPNAVLYRLWCADKCCDFCKRGGIDCLNLHGSKQLYALPCNKGIRCT